MSLRPRVGASALALALVAPLNFGADGPAPLTQEDALFALSPCPEVAEVAALPQDGGLRFRLSEPLDATTTPMTSTTQRFAPEGMRRFRAFGAKLNQG